MLRQGNIKNAFCQGILRHGKITIIKPPISDPGAKKDEYWLLKHTLYGLQRSPHHWYTKIKSILTKFGLRQNSYDPCLFSGTIIDPLDPTNNLLLAPLNLGLYVDNFVYFSAKDALEAKFQCLLKQYVTVDFMGTVEWFLGTHFQWSIIPTAVKDHLSQTGFTSCLIEENNTHHCNITPNATPY
jgi:hypothetical protein